MSIEDLIIQLPKYTAIIGDVWLKSNSHIMTEYISKRLAWFRQLDNDLTLLNIQVSDDKLISCYRDALRDRTQVQKTIYEVHGATLLSSIASSTDLHVPRGEDSGRNFDICVNIKGFVVNAESKTRKDEFPFNLPSSGNFYAGARATLDPHDVADLGVQPTLIAPGIHEIRNPESTVIRQCLLDGLEQLPNDGCNIIIFGHIEGDLYNLEDALFGTEVLEIVSDSATWVRTPTGAFCAGSAGEMFLSLSAVFRFKLSSFFDDDLKRAYNLYLNPYSLHPLHNEVTLAINKIIDIWTTKE